MPATFIKTPFMSQHALDACDENAMLNAMLAFELALAEVQEASGALPSGASQNMRRQLENATFNVADIAAGIASGGNVAIPFVKQGRALLADGLKRYWHQGATSQDVVDSALMLLLKPRLVAGSLVATMPLCGVGVDGVPCPDTHGRAHINAASTADHLWGQSISLGHRFGAEPSSLTGTGTARAIWRSGGRTLGLG